MNHPFSQRDYPCRFGWGRRAARDAAARGDLVVVVDVLCFSSTVATACHRGAVIYPVVSEEDAARPGIEADIAVHRRDVPGKGRFSLSPLTFLEVEPGTRVVLPSPNGGACARLGGDGTLAGCLLNATAVARAAALHLREGAGAVTVLACGERWEEPFGDEGLRFAIEDYLGAGAILAGIEAEQSPEARVCEATFRACRSSLAALLRDCGSGRELRERGFPGDVEHAAQLDLYDTVPVLRDGRFLTIENAKARKKENAKAKRRRYW
jgi:2-phosphosulfolactate phosphatase